MKKTKFIAYNKIEKAWCDIGVINLEKGCFLIGNSPTKETKIIKGKYTIPEIKEGHFVEFKDLRLYIVEDNKKRLIKIL